MIIDNQNKVFRPISITFEEEYEVKLFKAILEHAKQRIKDTEYVYNEEEMVNLIDELKKEIE